MGFLYYFIIKKHLINKKNEELEEMNSSAHFGEFNETKREDTNEILFQLTRSNSITKQLASVLSSLLVKVKDLEDKNKDFIEEIKELKVLIIGIKNILMRLEAIRYKG